MSIDVRRITKQFGSFHALTDVSFQVPAGNLVALLGPSGSGKTTLLRIIAGLEFPDNGEILVGGREITRLRPRDRQMGFVFQHYALFRHMTVFENIAFGLRVKRHARSSDAEIGEKVRSLLKLVQLDWTADRYPAQLSGGQRQRVALARALAVEPNVLLLDEPFGALDAKVRQELRRWLRQLHDEIHLTSVFVTHDQEEAMEVADRVVVMNNGRIEQIGTAEELYERPANPFVYRFLGNANRFPGRVHRGRAQIGQIELAAPEHADAHDLPAVGYVRPHDIQLERVPTGRVFIEAVVDAVHAIGSLVHLELVRQDGGGRIDAELTRERYSELKFQKGERVFIKVRNLRIYLKDMES